MREKIDKKSSIKCVSQRSASSVDASSSALQKAYYSSTATDIKKSIAEGFLPAQDTITMSLVNRESYVFFHPSRQPRLYDKKLQKLINRVPIDKIPQAARIKILIQLEQLRENSPLVFKKLQQNYLDRGILFPAVFSLQVDVQSLSAEEQRTLSYQAAEYNNFILLKYLLNKQRGEKNTAVDYITLGYACRSGNLKMIQWVLYHVHYDGMALTEEAYANRRNTPIRKIIESRHFKVMEWVLQQALSGTSRGQDIIKQFGIDRLVIIDVAVFGGRRFYQQMVRFNQERNITDPLLADANYYNDLINNPRAPTVEELDRLTDANNPELSAETVCDILFAANNPPLVAGFLQQICTEQGLPLFKGSFAEHSALCLFQIALADNDNLNVLQIVSNYVVEEHRRELTKEGLVEHELSEEILDQHFLNYVRQTTGMSYEEYCITELVNTKEDHSKVVEQLQLLVIKPTLKELVYALTSGAYNLAAIWASESMGELRVELTRDSLTIAIEESGQPMPEPEILEKLFDFTPLDESHLSTCTSLEA